MASRRRMSTRRSRPSRPTTRPPEGFNSSRSRADTRLSREPSCTTGCASCSTREPRRSCRCSRSKLGSHRLQATNHRPGNRRDSRRDEQRRRPLDAHRAKAHQDRGPQTSDRTAVHVRDHTRVSRTLWPERPERLTEGRGNGRCPRFELPSALIEPTIAPTALPFEDVEATDKTVH